MPWVTYPFSSPMHNELKKKFNIIGVPVVLVCDAQTGFLITSKGRKDIFDLGINCLKSWRDDQPLALKKSLELEKGAQIVEA